MKKVLAIIGAMVIALSMTVNIQAAQTGTAWDNSFDIEHAYQFDYCELKGFETRIYVENEKIASLIECIRKDRENITDAQLSTIGWGFEVNVQFTHSDSEEGYSFGRVYRIDANHTNTIQWVKDNGYWEYFEIKNEGPVYIIKKADFFPYMDFWDKQISLNFDDYEVAAKFVGEDAARVCEYMSCAPACNGKTEEYIVYQVIDAENSGVKYITSLTSNQVNELTK